MAGPLDIARRQKEKSFTPEIAGTIRQWLDPSLLALVQGTPVNCLVVSWASGLPADAEQQQALKPLLEKGRQAGLDFVGLIEASADKPAAIAAARAAGLSAVAMETIPTGDAGIPVIAWAKSGEALWSANSPILGVADGIWPGVPQEKAPTGGPTNLPWVDSNGALLGMARALAPWNGPGGGPLAGSGPNYSTGRAPNKDVWIFVEPPTKAKLTVANYLLTVADVETYGGHWVISLDDQMRAGLAAKSAQTAADWKKITDTVAFFGQNKTIRTYERMGRLAVMSNFAEPDRAFGEDTLNMFPRLREPFRVISKTQALTASLDGLQGIFFVDQVAPEPKLREKLTAFVKGGGTLFVRSTWPNPEGSPIQLSSEEDYLYFNVRQLGKGRLAVAKEENPDTYFTCMDVQNVMSHRGDPARLYNGASMNYFYQVSPRGRQGVIHVLNYSRLPGSANALIFLKSPYRSASFVSPEIAAPVALKWSPLTSAYETGGAELSLPPISVYGAIQMET